MRGWVAIGVLALAGCGEHQGWNPNYQFGSRPYGDYLAHREVTLLTGRDPVQGIPVARPALAPTPAEIAGMDPVPVPPTMRLRRIAVPADDGPTLVPPPRPEPAEPIAVVPAP
ncbi:hypothetical protein [Paracoccus beibuensis]|uniref:hypothetical protein n=1 Tax=Paracoccus beibuensis TaxID=547602 RepID=UPI00223F4C99|nr:hypothetical protein [Paracoccus beibuensis]